MISPARIAIVDDDPLFVDYLETFLRSKGYEVSAHASAVALLSTLGRSGSPEVVLLDVLMPSMNGLEALRMLRASHPDVAVIMLSGQQVPATIVDAVRLGAVDYVIKPDDPSGIGEAALENAIRNAVEKLALESEVARLSTRSIEDPGGAQPCWGNGAEMREIMTLVDRVADSDVSVLITGESGVGKEVIARELHRRSARRSKPFVKVNCAALPSELLESELFGHERGAFTGAQTVRIGKFEYASGGTLMLDEIGEMPAALQAKLLHVIQDHEFTKLGSNRPVIVDTRVLAATNRDLRQMIADGRFREDLYYRLQVIEVRVPPLRERRDEIPALLEFFLRRYSSRYGRPLIHPSDALDRELNTYAWPGNIRELENVVKRFVILRSESLVLSELRRTPVGPTAQSMPAAPTPAPVAAPFVAASSSAVTSRDDDGVSDDDGLPSHVVDERASGLFDLARAAARSAEREAIQHALDHFHWNRRKVARQLGVSYKTLLNKMKECGISAPAAAD